jgi:hypothetical protein
LAGFFAGFADLVAARGAGFFTDGRDFLDRDLAIADWCD